MKKWVKICWSSEENILYKGFIIERSVSGDYGEIYDYEDIESGEDLGEGYTCFRITCDDEKKMKEFKTENSHIKDLSVYYWFDLEDNCWFWGDIGQKGSEYDTKKEVKEACINWCKNLIDDFCVIN